MHTQPLSGNLRDCLTCHQAVGDAQTAIDAGKSSANPGPPAAQVCEACHVSKNAYSRHGLADDDTGGDTVVDVHEQFADQDISAGSDCVNCHTGNPLDTAEKIMKVHTRATTPTTCLTCHTAVAPTSTVIAAGWGSADPAKCDDCHTSHSSNWYNHTVDHTDQGLNAVLPDTTCTSCHDGLLGPNTTAPNSETSPYVTDATENHYNGGNGCATCHTSAGVLQARDGNYTTAMTAGTCSDCHTAYFDGHTVHTGSDGGHDVAYNATPDQVADGTGCASCHSPISTWSEVVSLHDYNGCATCHSYVGDNGEHKNTPEGTVATVILANDPATICTDCHTEKKNADHGYAPHNVDNGLGYAPITADADCITCHGVSGDNVVTDIHNND